MSADFSEFDKLNLDLTEAANIDNLQASQIVQQAAIRTKESWQKDALKTMPAMGKQYAPTIDYTVREYGGFGQGVYAAEIGPNLKRYGGKTGVGGLTPSMGVLDDPVGDEAKAGFAVGVSEPPSRARPRAEKFAEKDLEKGVQIAIDKTLKKSGL